MKRSISRRKRNDRGPHQPITALGKAIGREPVVNGQAALEIVVAPVPDLDIQLAVSRKDIITQAYSVRVQP